MLPLEMLRSGEWAEVTEVHGESSWVCRMAELGVRTGCRLQMLQGGCPCMFGPTADPGHKAMRFVYTLTGNVPRHV